MNGKELAQMVSDGIHPVVTFKAPISDKEGYLEPGMRGRLISVSNIRDEMCKLHVDLSEFDDFNRQFESANYYDKNQVPCLTARESGFYKGPKDDFYVGDDEVVDFCQIEEANRLGLYEDYKKAATKISYVQWLEDSLLACAAA